MLIRLQRQAWARALQQTLVRPLAAQSTFCRHHASSDNNTAFVTRNFSAPAKDPHSITTTAAASSTFFSVWEKTTHRLLDDDASVGSLDSFQLHELEQAIRWWCTFTSTSTLPSPSTDTAKAVFYSFELLDRLEEEIIIIAEQRHKKNNYKHFVAPASYCLTTELVALVVNHWRRTLKQQQQQQRDNSLEEFVILDPDAVLERIESYAANAPHFFAPTAQLYTMVLDGMSNWDYASPAEASSKAQQLLDYMEQQQQEDCQPTTVTLTTAIHIAAKHNDSHRALQLLQTMKNNSSSRAVADFSGPTLEAYGAVIGCLARSVRTTLTHHHWEDKVKVAQQAEDLLHEMEQDWNIPPSTVIYANVLHAWAQTGANDQAGKRAESLLNRMLQNYAPADSSGYCCKPNNYCFSAVMSAYAKSGNVQRVEQWLQQLQGMYEQTLDNDFFPNVFCFNALIEAWSNYDTDYDNHNNNNNSNAARNAEAVLLRMEEYAKQTGHDECLPNLVSFNLVLHTHAESMHLSSAERALSIVEHMKQVGLAPDTIAYNCVLQCLANAKRPEWSRKAEALVQDETIMPEPDVVSYATVIRAWAGVGDAERAEQFLRTMMMGQSAGRVQPDVSCFNAVMTAWSKSKSPAAGQRAEALLRFMTLDQNIHPDIVTYNAIMDCWSTIASSRRGQPITAAASAADRALSILRYVQTKEGPNIRPNAISFTTCAWAFAGAKQPKQAEALFREMRERSIHDKTVTPNLYTYCALISAWARVGQPLKAQAIFDTLLDDSKKDASLQPNTAVYSALLHAWAKAGDVGKAVSILQKMCNDYDEEGKHCHAKPDERCFSAVINALSRSKHPDAAPQAESCLLKMQEMAESGLEHVRPNVFTFQSVISAWANSDLPVAAEQADANLQRLKDMYYNHGDTRCRPNVIAYTNTLRAWSRASGGGYVSAQKAVERSEALLEEMLQSEIPAVHPNRITFGTILRTIAESGLPDKLHRAERIGSIMQDHNVDFDSFAKEQLKKARS